MATYEPHHEGKNDNDGAKTYKERCPVCSSPNIETSLEWSFHGVPHHFCCEHCRGRFQRRPHLYVGSPQLKAAKQLGKTVPKSHHIGLPATLDDTRACQLCERILVLPGVRSCHIEGRQVAVDYDLMVISLKTIEQVVIQEVGELKDTLTERGKRKALHFAEENELDNLAHLSDSGRQYHF